MVDDLTRTLIDLEMPAGYRLCSIHVTETPGPNVGVAARIILAEDETGKPAFFLDLPMSLDYLTGKGLEAVCREIADNVPEKLRQLADRHAGRQEPAIVAPDGTPYTRLFRTDVPN